MLQFEPSKGKNSVVVEEIGTPCSLSPDGSSSTIPPPPTVRTAKKGSGIREVSPGQGFWRSQVDHMAHYLKHYLRTQDALQVSMPDRKALSLIRAKLYLLYLLRASVQSML